MKRQRQEDLSAKEAADRELEERKKQQGEQLAAVRAKLDTLKAQKQDMVEKLKQVPPYATLSELGMSDTWLKHWQSVCKAAVCTVIVGVLLLAVHEHTLFTPQDDAAEAVDACKIRTEHLVKWHMPDSELACRCC